MLPKHPRSRVSTRGRHTMYAMGAAALAVPLAFSSSVTAFAQTPAPTPVPLPPIEAINAIEGDALLADFQNEYLGEVVADNIWQTDVKLAGEIGPRVRGSEAELEAVNWVADKFESYGLTTAIEDFEIKAVRFADAEPSRNTDDWGSWQFSHAANGPLKSVDAEVVDIASDTAGLADRTDLAGKIVLVNWDGVKGSQAAVVRDLQAAGAAAVMFARQAAPAPAPEALVGIEALATEQADMMVLGAALNQATRIRTLLADGPLTLNVETKVGSTTSHNAIGTLPAASGNPDAPIIYLGAHIDSVPGSPGASDNGSGVSILVEIARIMSEHKYDAEIRFGVWGAEEGGIVGSNYHVKSVMSADEQARTLGAWNMDMAGTSFPGFDGQPPFQFWALTADTKRDPLAPSESPVLDFSNQVSLIAGKGDLPIGTVGRSDHQPFHDVGIKAAVFSWMHWGGGTNIILEPAYHQTTDTLEFVSAENMAHAARILGGGAFRAAMNTADITVLDRSAKPAADTRVALSCEGDTGWRDGGRTNAEGKLTVFVPTTSCDVVALADNGERAFAADRAFAEGAVAVDLELRSVAPAFAVNGSQQPSASGWYLETPVNVTVGAENEFGDALTVQHSSDGQTWQPGAENASFDEDGRYELLVRATDSQGTVTDASELILVDSTAPSIAVVADAAKRGAVSGTAIDETSGVAAVQYRIGEGEWTDVKFEAAAADAAPTARSAAPQFTEAAKFAAQLKLGNGATTVEFRALDTAGNASDAGSVKFAAAPGSGLSNTGAEPAAMFAIAAAALVLLGGGAMLMVRRNRAQQVNEDA